MWSVRGLGVSEITGLGFRGLGFRVLGLGFQDCVGSLHSREPTCTIQHRDNLVLKLCSLARLHLALSGRLS